MKKLLLWFNFKLFNKVDAFYTFMMECNIALLQSRLQAKQLIGGDKRRQYRGLFV